MNDVKNISLKEIFAPVYWDVANLIINSNRDILMYGGRSSGKGTTAYEACILYLLMNSNRSILVNAPTKESIGKTVFKQVKETIDILQKMLCFDITPKKITVSPHKIVFQNGSEFIFNGLIDGQKGVTGIDKVVIDEMGEIIGSFVSITNTLNDMMNTYNRNGTQIIKIGNPPKSIASFFNFHIDSVRIDKEYLIEENKKLYNRYELGKITKEEYNKKKKITPYLLHTTCYDIPREWNDQKNWQSIEIKKRQEEAGLNKNYTHEILGIPTGTGYEVFSQIEEITIDTKFINSIDNDKIYVGLDEGHSVDPLALVVCYYEQEKQELWLLHEFYGTHKTFDQIEQAILQYVHPYHMPATTRSERQVSKVIRLGERGIPIFADSQASRFIENLRARDLNVIAYKKKRSGTSEEISFMENNLNKIYIDPKRTPNCLKEFTEYAHKTDAKGTPTGEYSDKNNHTVDAVRYAIGASMRTKPMHSVVFVG